MSKFFKGIAKVLKNIGSGLKKVFKKVIKSKLFKIVLISVAVYFGGAALGLWGGGAAGAASGAAAVVPGATTAATTGAATTAATTGAATTTAATGAGLSTAAQTSAALTAAPAATTGVGLATAGETAAALTAAPAAAAAAPSFLGTLGSGLSSVGSFIQANPLASAMGFNALSSALAPDEMELLQAQEDARKREFEAGLASRRENLTGFSTLPLLHQARGTTTSLRERRRGSL